MLFSGYQVDFLIPIILNTDFPLFHIETLIR